jgi:gas vesicle protein
MHNGHYKDEESEDFTGLTAFVAGALIGAGVALLFAPQQGTELRGRLRDYANRAKDDLMDMGQEAMDTAVERGKQYYRKGEDTVRDMGRSAKEFAKQAQDLAEGRDR